MKCFILFAVNHGSFVATRPEWNPRLGPGTAMLVKLCGTSYRLNAIVNHVHKHLCHLRQSIARHARMCPQRFVKFESYVIGYISSAVFEKISTI